MIRPALFIIALFPFMMAAVGCESDTTARTAPAEIPSNLTLDEVYRRMEQAIDADGKIVHVSVVIEDVDFGGAPTPPALAGFDAEHYADQLWLDASAGAARSETSIRNLDEAADRVSRSIIRSGDTFRVDSDGNSAAVESLTCRGSDSPLLAQLMRCGNYLEESKTVVESGEYQGRPAIVLTTSGQLPSHDWTSSFTTRLYIDPSSNLPIAIDTQESGAGDHAELSYRIQERYDIEFLARSSLPDDFFEPASIGYVERDPTANLAPTVDGMPVYWLGERYTPSTTMAGLALQSSAASPRRPPLPASYAASLTYGLADQRYGGPIITLQEFPVDAWSSLNPDTGGHFWNGAGVTREDVPVAGGRAVLFRVPASYERYLAHVYFESTVILLLDDQPSPYANREAFIALIKALRPYK